MSLMEFLGQNIPLMALLVLLFIAVMVVEYWDNGRGVRKLSSHEAVKFMNDKRSLLVDLRDYAQFEKGYIQGAKQIAWEALRKTANEHIKKKDTPVLLIDTGEQRALKTATDLKKQGFLEVHILKGGMESWHKENLPLTNKTKR